MLSLTHPMLGLVVGEGTAYAFFDTSHVRFGGGGGNSLCFL